MRYRQEICLPLKRHRQVGFSLIEVLIVLGILTIVAIIAVPQIDSMVESHRLSGAARTIWSDLHKARMTAIKENRNIRITVCNTIESPSYTIVRVDTGVVIFTRDLECKESGYPGVTVIGTLACGGAAANPVNITFNSRGTADGGTITVRGFDRPERKVIVAWTGMIRIQ